MIRNDTYYVGTALRHEDDNSFAEMFEALPVGVYATDSEGRLTYANPAAAKLAGRAPKVGEDQWSVYMKIFLPDGTPLPHEDCPMARALRGEESVTGIELIAERPDGSRIWYEPHPTPIRDREGRIKGGINVLLDITERKLAQQASEEHFRTVFDTTPECVKLVASDGTILHMNSSGLSMLGASCADEVIGKSVYELVVPKDRERFRQFNEAVCRGEKGFLEFEIYDLHGFRRYMETHAAPLRHSNGTTVQLGVTRDVTDRRQVERDALLLSAIVDSSDDAIISKDLNGIITSWNKSAERLFGYTAAEAIGQPVTTLLIPPDRQEEEPEILSRLRRGERVDHFETKRKRKDGNLLDISLTISPVKDLRGHIIGASKIARDITDQVRNQQALRKANEALKQANADLEQFAYSASHDLQEPLRMVAAYSDLLQKRFGSKLDEKADEYLGYIAEGSARMDRLLHDLRAFAQLSLGNEDAPPEIDANAVLENALVNLKSAIEQSGTEITCGPLPSVCLHEFQLEQLFQNLIGNAIRYRSELRPKINITAARDGNEWKFSIQDNGIGIADEYKEEIFGIFKRLHTASEYPGTGMGLAICQRIVERAGGRIWVESQPGCGSTFFFTVPAGTAAGTHS